MKLSLHLAALSALVLSTSPTRGQDLYAMTGAGNVQSILYRISPTTGQVLQTIGNTGTTHITAIEFSPTTGVMYGHISNAPTTTQLITINPATAQFTVIGNTGQQVPDMT